MAHIITRTKDGMPRRDVPEAWLPATANATEYAIRVSGKHGIAVQVGPKIAAEAGTAQYVPSIATIMLSSEVVIPGARPEDVVFTDELFRARFPLAVGALLHETAHARWSRWTPIDLTRGEATGRFKGRKSEVLTLLEESRIERKLVDRYATARDYLPSIVFDLLQKEMKGGGSDAYTASVIVALILGREVAGIIGTRDAKPFRDAVSPHLSDEQIETLLGLVGEYHALTFDRWAPLPLNDMESIANRWLETLGDDPAEEAEGAVTVMVMHSEGEGEGEGSGGGSEGSEGSEDGEDEGGLAQQARDAAAEAKHDKQMGAADKVKRIRERRADEGRKAMAERKDEAEHVADEVFRPGVGADGGAHEVASRSKLRPRDPRPEERAAATIFSKALAKVRTIEPARTTVAMSRPGKKIRGNALLARKAARDRGQLGRDVKIWEGRKREFTDEPPLKVGVVVDVSGSMRELAEPMAVTGYIVGNGVEKAGGEFSQVVFGTKATGVVKAGRKVKHVPYVSPRDSWENIKEAVLALDHDLDLIDGDGARVLVLASDGLFVRSEQHAWADTMFPAMVARGVTIIHLDFENGRLEHDYAHSHYNARHNNPIPPLVVPTGASPQEVAKLIGDKIIAEVKKANARKVAA